MCCLCNEGEFGRCEVCGCTVCFDVEDSQDDVLLIGQKPSKAYSNGERVLCIDCYVPQEDPECKDIYEDYDFEDLPF